MCSVLILAEGDRAIIDMEVANAIEEMDALAQMDLEGVLQRRVQEVLLEHQDHQDLKDSRDILEWRVCQGPKEIKEHQESKDHEDKKETEGKWECLDFLVLMVFLE